MHKFVALFVFILSGCGVTVTFVPQGRDTPDAQTAPDAIITADATPITDTNPVQEDRAPIVVDAGTPDAAGQPDECRPGETRHCYSGSPETEGVGRCHGSTTECTLVEGRWRWTGNCVGEVTPWPWGDLPANHMDDDCDGLTDEDSQRTFCNERGCYFFCERWSWPPNRNAEAMGYHGCCSTTGRFHTLEEFGGTLHGQMLLKGRGPEVYYYNGVEHARHLLPTTFVLNSWYTPSDQDYAHNPEVCASVTEVDYDEMLGAIRRGRDVTLRPGSMYAELASNDGYRWVVSRGRVLHQLRPSSIAVDLFPASVLSAARLVLLPDTLVTGYFSGTNITDPSQYNARAEWDTTIERELGM